MEMTEHSCDLVPLFDKKKQDQNQYNHNYSCINSGARYAKRVSELEKYDKKDDKEIELFTLNTIIKECIKPLSYSDIF